jgi:hypothetical protein
MSDYEITGPIETRRVIVDGRRVPFLEAFPMAGGKISLLLDGRYSLDIPVGDAEAFVPWIADAIAVAMGYTCHPRRGEEPVKSSPFPPDQIIGWMDASASGSGTLG